MKKSRDEELKELLDKMCIEEKVNLLIGLDFWHISGIERLRVKPVNLTDGSHGLRKQEDDADSPQFGSMVKATCFPAACTTACSFDTALLEKMGQAMGEEAKSLGVAMILGPGVNIKRNPLCGRNFEYFSEDPFLTGTIASGLIRGIESQNIGACVKHFAANNQETWRMVGDSVVDERALREIYLTTFETVLQESNPSAVMCSYNRLNGQYATENKELLGILRKEWDFNGTVISDWGATNDKVASLKAGMDLTMPGPIPCMSEAILQAIKRNEISEEQLNLSAGRILNILMRGRENHHTDYDKDAHHLLSGEIAAQCAVLLENDGTLPLKRTERLAVLGSFAKNPKFQGGGSSDIPYTKTTSFLDALDEAGITYEYAEGYQDGEEQLDPIRRKQALDAINHMDTILVFVGLPESYESESFDRENLNLPGGHQELVELALETGKPVTVVLMQGSPTILPFRRNVNAMLLVGLTGQNGGYAIRELLYGRINPSGRLAETYPLDLTDVASTQTFGQRNTQYRESIYVGYRWFDSADIPVQYPFGYGLSYTSFTYRTLTVSKSHIEEGESLTVTLDVTNTGTVAGQEVVQVYVSFPESRDTFFSKHELKGFTKVFLESGETKTVTIHLPARSFCYYDTKGHRWRAKGGTYQINAAKSSRDIVLTACVQISGQTDGECNRNLTDYFNLKPGHVFGKESFAALYGKPFPQEPALLPFTINSPLSDLKQKKLGAFVLKRAMKPLRKQFGAMGDKNEVTNRFDAIIENTVFGMPFRSLQFLTCGKLSSGQVEGLVAICNGHLFRGIRKFIQAKGRGGK